MSCEQSCPVCSNNKLKQYEDKFKWICYKCNTVFDKKCPCHYIKGDCYGCQYFEECRSHSPSKDPRDAYYETN